MLLRLIQLVNKQNFTLVCVLTVFNVLCSQRLVVVSDNSFNQPLPGIELDCNSTAFITNELGQIRVSDKNNLDFNIDSSIGVIVETKNFKADTSIIYLKIKGYVSEINPVSVTTSARPRLATDETYSLRVVSSKTIKQMGAQTIADVIQNQTSIILNNDASLGTSMQLQGMGGQNVKILINGVPVIGRLNGNIDISQIPINEIEKIEIIEGPMSVVYGTDAIGGVINIITRNPYTTKDRLTINSYSDSRKNYNFDFGANKALSLTPEYQINMNLSGGRQFFDGFDFDTTTRSVDWKPKVKYFGKTGFSLSGSKFRQNLTFQYFQEKLTDRSNAEYNLISVNGYNNYFRTYRADIAAITLYSPTQFDDLRFQNAYNYFLRRKMNVRRNLVTGNEIITRPSDQDTTINTQINLRGLWEHRTRNKNFQSLVGYEFTRESLSTLRINGNNQINDFAIFTSIEYVPIIGLKIKPSIRVAYNNAFGENPFPNILGNKFKVIPAVPSLQFKYDLSKHLVIRGSFAKGFRAPTAKELYFLFVDINHNVQGNPNLLPERSDNWVASVDYRHRISNNIQAKFKVNFFYNEVNNQIQLSLVNANTNLYRYINIGKMHTQGGSLNTDLFINQLKVTLGGSIIQNESNISDNISEITRWTVKQANLNLNYTIKKHNIGIHYFSRFTGKTVGFTSSVSPYEIPGFTLSDLSLSKNWKKLRIQGGAKNIFNITQVGSIAQTGGVHGSSNAGLNIGMGRTIFIQCNINL